ncbi:MAG: helix-turn-helix transcriptional regulator [Oscillospiraceae bacterium]|nr:helix-turn-helix transcriptional regulator [Oscillospiraceae bacterium]
MPKKSAKKSMFSKNMAKLRQEKGLSQRQASAELGISQALLSHYENDTREPKLEFIIKVCDFYAVTTDFILGRTSERADGSSRLCTQVCEAIDMIEELREAESNIIQKLKALTEN